MSLLFLLFLITQVTGQITEKMAFGQRFQYPMFLMQIPEKDGISKLSIYNFNTEQDRFEEHDNFIINFNENTFYVRKLNSYNDDRGLEIHEYFRINTITWREVTTKAGTHDYRNLIVLDEIVARDTFLTFNLETYEDTYHVIEFQHCD